MCCNVGGAWGRFRGGSWEKCLQPGIGPRPQACQDSGRLNFTDEDSRRVKYISIVNPKRLQHYKQRNPPWIKLYRDIFSDPDFQKLTDSARLQLFFLETLAPEFDNKIPYDPEYLRRRLAPKGKLQIEAIARAGDFIKILEFATDGENGSGRPKGRKI